MTFLSDGYDSSVMDVEFTSNKCPCQDFTLNPQNISKMTRRAVCIDKVRITRIIL